MSTLSVDVNSSGSVRTVDPTDTLAEIEEYDFSKLPNRPKNLNIERHRSYDERSLADLPGFSPHVSCRAENSFGAIDHFDGLMSPGRRSGFDTPRSQFGFDPHPMIADARDALRCTLVFFRGQPVGTIPAMDSSEEKLNYDQEKPDITFPLSRPLASFINF